jgi:hypothetical protein
MEEAGEETSLSASFTLLRLARDLKVNLPSRGLPKKLVLRICCYRTNFMLLQGLYQILITCLQQLGTFDLVMGIFS